METVSIALLKHRPAEAEIIKVFSAHFDKPSFDGDGQTVDQREMAS